MSKYFTVEELCHSAIAKQQGIDNTPNKEAKENLQALIDKVLDPIRKAWGEPIVINSGYRSEKLNFAVRGAKNSQHMAQNQDAAADIVPENKTKERVKKLFECIKKTGIIYDQLINEKDYSWVHISYKRKGLNRKQELALK